MLSGWLELATVKGSAESRNIRQGLPPEIGCVNLGSKVAVKASEEKDLAEWITNASC